MAFYSQKKKIEIIARKTVLYYTILTIKWSIDAATNRRASAKPGESGWKSAQKLWEFEWNRPIDWDLEIK